MRFHLHDMVHLDASLLLSITEVGFRGGGGGALLLGDPYGSNSRWASKPCATSAPATTAAWTSRWRMVSRWRR
ncbi:MAG: hypothetical protein U0263_21430 [Polyangiaceae bacterium]